MTPSKGLLIALEGIDGAGKSSLSRRLAGRWRREGRRVLRLREPVDRQLGRSALALAVKDPWAAAMLFTLDRSLGRERVRQALSRGAIVLQDRSFYSTLAYQGSRLPPDARRALGRLQREVAEVPDRVLWLDLPPREAVGRVRRRSGPRAAVERIRFLSGVRRAYRSLSRAPDWIHLDASRPPKEVAEEAERQLALPRNRRLPSRRPRP